MVLVFIWFHLRLWAETKSLENFPDILSQGTTPGPWPFAWPLRHFRTRWACTPASWRGKKPASFVGNIGFLQSIFGLNTSSTAQGGGRSFRNRKPIGEVGCCESRMAERNHWRTDRWLRSPLFLWLSTYLPIYLLPRLPTTCSGDISGLTFSQGLWPRISAQEVVGSNDLLTRYLARIYGVCQPNFV